MFLRRKWKKNLTFVHVIVLFQDFKCLCVFGIITLIRNPRKQKINQKHQIKKKKKKNAWRWNEIVEKEKKYY